MIRRILFALLPLPLLSATARPFPADLEKGFQQRAETVVEATAQPGRYGTTFFESEKRAYGLAMLAVLGGYEKEGMAYLQSEDADAKRWHAHTEGIDLFPAFTLKHQVRKYFYFGDKLEPDYRKRMQRAFKTWTAKDPLRRPHPAYKKESGWGPNAKNSWVDVRSTDNLKLMRDTSVYLFAEEVGNKATRDLYRDRLHAYVSGLYKYGMSEWDSENYLGHSIAPLLNLHDFAKDKEVRAIARAGLDFMAVSGALKYFRGNFGGPTKRDYNHPYPFGGSAASMLWLWFGDAPQVPHEFDVDAVHAITSSYRPPVEAVKIARRQIDLPVQLYAGKPGVAQWDKPELAAPVFQETLYIDRHFTFGTLAKGTQNPDVNGFTILTYSSKRGADTILAAPCNDPTKLGSPMYKDGLLAKHSAVAQDRNTAIYLTEESAQPYLFTVPSDAKLSRHGDATVVETEKTYLTIWPINLAHPKPDRALTENFREKKPEPFQDALQILRADRAGAGLYGFAVELAPRSDKRYLSRIGDAELDLSRLSSESAAVMKFPSGNDLGLRYGRTDESIGIWRDGQRRQLHTEKALFDSPLITLPWQSDTPLTVLGKQFPQP